MSKLNINDLLPDKFQSGPHKHLMVLAVDNPKYSEFPADADSKEPELLDTFIIKANLPKEIKHDGSKQQCKILLYDNLTVSGCNLLMEWIRTSFEGLSGRTYLPPLKLHVKFLDQIGSVIKIETLYNATCVGADFDFKEYQDVEASIVLEIEYQ